MQRTIPVVGLAGFSGSGKTTFLEKLIVELKNRGYRVGIVKHTHHEVDFDRPGTDSWRHAKAGADVVALAAPAGVSLVKKCDSDPAPEEVIAMIDGVDLVVVEGYKRGKWAKIEVFRQGVAERPTVSPEELIAVVSDAPLSTAAPCFGLDDAAGVAGLIEEVILKTPRPGVSER